MMTDMFETSSTPNNKRPTPADFAEMHRRRTGHGAVVLVSAEMGDNAPRGKGKPKAAATFTSHSRAGEIITGRATWW